MMTSRSMRFSSWRTLPGHSYRSRKFRKRGLKVRFFRFPAEPGQELVGQGEDVLLALPQGRDVDADDVEPVEEVGAEQAPLDLLLQIAVGGHDQPEVQFDLPGAGEAFDGLFWISCRSFDWM
jgi:hypothetical protein